ncbi:hypothetical protein V1460_18225 [Streptomyces sp. SCSIO 30461]|uniref:hypothetical protein n=1 Tax=Streptomyces sp. SCSIO 30461 TaxID=3118085 RepID=UPI0030CEB636
MRIFMGGIGLVVMGFGAWLLFGTGDVRDPWDVVIWLGGAIVLHDVLIAPVVLAVGSLLAVLPGRPVIRAAMIVCGALTLIALPPLLRPGAPANPSALPLDYVDNWLLASGVVAVLAATALILPRAVRALAARRTRHREESDGADSDDAAGDGRP